MVGIVMPEVILALVIVLIIFGRGKLPEVCKTIGKAIMKPKKAMDEPEEIRGTFRGK